MINDVHDFISGGSVVIIHYASLRINPLAFSMKWQSWNRVLGLSSRAIFLTTQRLLDVSAVVQPGCVDYCLDLPPPPPGMLAHHHQDEYVYIF